MNTEAQLTRSVSKYICCFPSAINSTYMHRCSDWIVAEVNVQILLTMYSSISSFFAVLAKLFLYHCIILNLGMTPQNYNFQYFLGYWLLWPTTGKYHKLYNHSVMNWKWAGLELIPPASFSFQPRIYIPILAWVTHLIYRKMSMDNCLVCYSQTTSIQCRADIRRAPSQWEAALQSNAFSHWLSANL